MQSGTGFWTPHTANHDFCEGNYEHSFYVVEFFNTISALVILFTGLYNFSLVIRYKLPAIFSVVTLFVAVVGLGSVAFHGTMKRWGQISDEVPMVWGVTTYILAILYLEYKLKLPSLISLLLIFASIATTIIYFVFSFEVFIIMYAILVVFVFLRSWKLKLKHHDPDQNLLHTLACVAYAGGFIFLWIPIELFCESVASDVARTYFHSIFHLTSSYGPHCMTQFLFWHFAEIAARPCRVIWFFGVPFTLVEFPIKHKQQRGR